MPASRRAAFSCPDPGGLAAGLAIVAVLAPPASAASTSSAVSRPARLALRLVGGGTLDLGEQRGRVVLVACWGVWWA